MALHYGMGRFSHSLIVYNDLTKSCIARAYLAIRENDLERLSINLVKVRITSMQINIVSASRGQRL